MKLLVNNAIFCIHREPGWGGAGKSFSAIRKKQGRYHILETLPPSAACSEPQLQTSVSPNLLSEHKIQSEYTALVGFHSNAQNINSRDIFIHRLWMRKKEVEI